MGPRISRLTVPAVLAVGAIALAGCGGSSNKSSAYSGSSGNSGSSTGANSGNSGNSGSSSTSGGGGGGAALSPQDDANKVGAANHPVKAASAGIKANPDDPNAWQQLSSTAKQASDTINGLTAPSSMQSSQQALGAALSTLSDSASKVADDLKSNNASAAQADKVQYAKDALAYGSAALTWAQAGRAAGAQ